MRETDGGWSMRRYRTSYWLDGQDYFVIPHEAASVQEAIESACDACYQAIARLEEQGVSLQKALVCIETRHDGLGWAPFAAFRLDLYGDEWVRRQVVLSGSAASEVAEGIANAYEEAAHRAPSEDAEPAARRAISAASAGDWMASLEAAEEAAYVDQREPWARFARAVREAVRGLLDEVR